jgi:hypothetical protein
LGKIVLSHDSSGNMQSHMLKIFYKFNILFMGLLLLGLGRYLDQYMRNWQRRESLWTPIHVKLNAQQKTARTEFLPEFEMSYHIRITSPQASRNAELKHAQLPCPGADLRIILDGQIVPLSGSRRCNKESYELGSFQVKAHKPHSIQVELLNPTQEFYDFNPHLDIRVDSTEMVYGSLVPRQLAIFGVEFSGIVLITGFFVKQSANLFQARKNRPTS